MQDMLGHPEIYIPLTADKDVAAYGCGIELK
jgi:uncharacterized Zn-finger protein